MSKRVELIDKIIADVVDQRDACVGEQFADAVRALMAGEDEEEICDSIQWLAESMGADVDKEDKQITLTFDDNSSISLFDLTSPLPASK